MSRVACRAIMSASTLARPRPHHAHHAQASDPHAQGAARGTLVPPTAHTTRVPSCSWRPRQAPRCMLGMSLFGRANRSGWEFRVTQLQHVWDFAIAVTRSKPIERRAAQDIVTCCLFSKELSTRSPALDPEICGTSLYPRPPYPAPYPAP